MSGLRLTQFLVTRATHCNSVRGVATSLRLDAKGVKASEVPTEVREGLSVETDPQKLHDYVCGANYMKDQEPLKVKDDSEYPDWLWTLRLGKPLPLEELDPDTKYYWRRLRTIAMKERNKLRKKARF